VTINNWLRINCQEDSLQLSWQQGNQFPRSAEVVAFQHPFDDNALAELRWYLESYLRFPYGNEPNKAAAIEQQLQQWGEQLFNLIFRSGEKAREFLQEAIRSGLDNCELAISSDNPDILNLPWEILYSPDYQFLAPQLGGMYRSLSTQPVKAALGQLPQDQLNILLVIARPYGERDIALKTIARPLLQALEPIRQYVNLKVLRPPSFEEFERELNAHKGFYHIVHFDGHGDFDAHSQGWQHQLGSTGQGVLVFESLTGEAQIITAAQIAQNLADCRVPLFVLNACKSGQEGEGKFSSVATRLISLGAQGVVAMAYSVYAEAAKHFIGRLYGEIVLGKDLASAVASGRKQILNQNLRPSPKGQLPLQDWLVPILYQQSSYIPFVPRNAAPSFADLMAQADSSTAKNPYDVPDAAAYGFIGRDYELLKLERAFRQTHVVLLKGMGGVGKTELAKGFAQWLADTQGRTGGIFFTSFEQGAGLSQVVNQIGRRLGGDRFSMLAGEQQQQVVLDYLKTNPSLLIWDNFESVAGFPAGNEALLPEAERDSLKQFLRSLRGGQSWVLITSRREETWLDCGYALQSIKGLRQEEAEELAAKILLQAEVDRTKLPPEYLELLKLLGGHPLSLRVVLPHLKRQTPVQLIEALRQGLATFQGVETEGRDKSLMVSLAYSFTKLSPRTRQHLPFLALFSERVDAEWLHAFSESPDDDYGQAYQAVFGENLPKADWIALLEEAAAAGIIEHLDATIYKIHPALPWYLRQQLAQQHPAGEVAALEKKLLTFYTVLADNYREKLVSNAKLAMLLLQVEEPNLLQQLRLAEQQQSWAESQAILQALGEVYQRTGRKPELKMLEQRAINQVGIHLAVAKAKGQAAVDFWMYLKSNEANEALQSADLEKGREIYQEILDELIGLNDASFNNKIAVVYHQLGMVAQEKRQFEDAIAYYHKALKIYEDAGDFYSAARDYHQLGNIAYLQRQFEGAIAYYHQALKIREDAGDFYRAANQYHQLGVVAQEQRQFEAAIPYYHKALKIYEDAGDFYRAANQYHQLGVVAQEQRQFEAAIAYYHKALKIKEDAGDFYQAASDYHQLGMVAEEQRQFEDAIAYYHKALKIREDVGDFYSAARDYHQLGMVAQEQRQFEEAIAYYQKAFQILEQYQDWRKASSALSKWGNVLETQANYSDAARIYIQALEIDLADNQEWVPSDIKDLGRMLAALGATEFETIWQEVTGSELAGEMREVIWQAAGLEIP